MAIPRPRSERGAKVSAARRTLPSADIADARREARDQLQRARRVEAIRAELAEYEQLTAAMLAAAKRLGVRPTDDDTDPFAAHPEIGDAFVALGVCAYWRLKAECSELERTQLATPTETEAEAWRRVLVERGMSAGEAARVSGGHAEHVQAKQLPPGETRKAERSASRLKADARARLKASRAEMRELQRRPPGGLFDFRYLREADINAEISRLELILNPRRE